MTVWLDRRLIQAIHLEQLREHGGAPGLRDEGLLESALARPLNRAGYGDSDIAELAALYALAIARNHPFIDGNKRTAYVALELFSDLNGVGTGWISPPATSMRSWPCSIWPPATCPRTSSPPGCAPTPGPEADTPEPTLRADAPLRG